MTAKKYLMQIYDLNKEVESKLSERNEIMNTLTKAVDTTNEPMFNTGTVSNPTEQTALRLIEYNDQANAYIDELADLKIQIAEEIMQLDTNNYRMVLRERYIHCKKFEQIAVDMSYDYSWVVRLHGRALKEFGEKHSDKINKALKNK